MPNRIVHIMYLPLTSISVAAWFPLPKKDGAFFKLVLSEWLVSFIRIDDGLFALRSFVWNNVVYNQFQTYISQFSHQKDWENIIAQRKDIAWLMRLKGSPFQNTDPIFYLSWVRFSKVPVTERAQSHILISKFKQYRSRFWHPNESILFLYLIVLLYNFKKFWNPHLEWQQNSFKGPLGNWDLRETGL